MTTGNNLTASQILAEINSNLADNTTYAITPALLRQPLADITASYINNSTGIAAANPTASVGLTAVNGTAATFTRSDGAPALSQAIAPTWTGAHTFTSAAPQVTLGVAAGAGGQITLEGSTSGSSTFSVSATGGATYQTVAGGNHTFNDGANGACLIIGNNNAGAVANQITVKGNNTNNEPFFLASGTDTNIGIGLIPKGTGAVNVGLASLNTGTITIFGSTSGSSSLGVNATGSPFYGGTSTNDSASAGNIGEYVSATVTSGSTLNVSTTQNITSISLTAGDWDVSGLVIDALGGISGGTSIVTIGSISTTSGTLDSTDTRQVNSFFDSNAALPGAARMPVGPTRFSLSGTTTVYLITEWTASGGTGTITPTGTLRARRIR